MLLIEAARIAPGGGGVLLDYLLSRLVARGVDFTVVVAPTYPIPAEIAPVAVIRRRLTLRNRASAFRALVADLQPHTVLCFGNFPPPAPLPGIRVLAYFHRALLLDYGAVPGAAHLTQLKMWALTRYLAHCLPYADEVCVQTPTVAEGFRRTFGFARDRISEYPFYDDEAMRSLRPTPPGGAGAKHIEERFIYVSSGDAHKNHARLIAAWELLAERGLFPELMLTLRPGGVHDSRIRRATARGCAIRNLGFLPHADVLEHTRSAQYAIYPSLVESLGLGLVEAAFVGCALLCADLPYVGNVVAPAAVFNPYDPESIADCVTAALAGQVELTTEVRLANRIDAFVDHLTSP